MKWTLLGVLISVMLVGCAGKPKQPDWIAGNSANYPANTYLLGRGQGESPAIARDRARADLAKVFQVAVVESAEDITTFQQSGTGKQAQQEYTQSVSRQVYTRTNQIIEGVVIAEQWADPETGQNHALAILDRNKTAFKLRAEISRLDSATTASLQAARAADDLINRIGAADRAVNSQLARRAHQKLLRIVDRTGRGVTEQYNLGRLIGDLEELLQRLKIAAVANDSGIADLQAIAAGAVNHAGFKTSSEDQADYIMQTQTRLVRSHDAQGWYWLRGSVTVNLLRQTDRVPVGTHQWPIKVSAQQEGVAEQRARDKVESVLKSDLRKVVIGFGKTS
jgi:hypothetical protein